ncbi:MAG: hypothetical protein R3F59_20250 [Myxococcota bacterium]
MHVNSVHERIIARPVREVFADLVAMGTPADRIWPAPKLPFVRSAGAMTVGATTERHGPIRAVLQGYVPDATICWRADLPFLQGTHAFEVQPVGPDRTQVRHVLDARVAWWFAPLWRLQVASAHDRILEALLTRLAEA